MADKVLIVDDDPAIRKLLEKIMHSNDLETSTADSGLAALNNLLTHSYDAILMDIMLGDMEGFEVIKRIRSRGIQTPVMIISGRNEDFDTVYGLSLGADDYITKPFRPLELVARVKAQLRRYKHYNSGSGMTDDIISCSGLSLNVKTHECTLNERPLTLTPTEFSILCILCSHKGNVVSAEELFHQVWGDEYFNKSNNTITVHIRHLREKMGDSFDEPKYIKTVWGCGYKIEA